MNSAYNVIIRPVVSERSFDLMSQNKYTFEVAKQAPKEEIAAAVEKLFGVHVLKVNTINVKPRRSASATSPARPVPGRRPSSPSLRATASSSSLSRAPSNEAISPLSMRRGRVRAAWKDTRGTVVIRRHLAEATRRLSRHMPERVGLIP